MFFLRRALFLVVLTLLAAAGPVLSGGTTSGSVLYKGKTSKLQSCYAAWDPKNRELTIDFATDPKGEKRWLMARYRFKGAPSQASLEHVFVLVGGSMNLGGHFSPKESLTWVKQLVFEPKLGGKVQIKLEGASPSDDPEWNVKFSVQCTTTVAKVY